MTTNNHESEPRTPRTDAIVCNHCEGGPFVSDHHIALSHFARTLELELNEANEKLVAAKRLQRLTEDNEIRWMQEHTQAPIPQLPHRPKKAQSKSNFVLMKNSSSRFKRTDCHRPKDYWRDEGGVGEG